MKNKGQNILGLEILSELKLIRYFLEEEQDRNSRGDSLRPELSDFKERLKDDMKEIVRNLK